ncbi:MAG: hypothetical protein ABIP95_11155 [Pelobium sp.]
MKWGLRFFGLLDLLTFLIFIPSKFYFLISTFEFPFSAATKVGAIWELMVLLFFLLTGTLLFLKPKTGLLFSFILVPFRIVFLYFSFDFLSFLLYHLGFKNLVSSAGFQHYWFYVLMVFEMLRYGLSFYWYSILKRI